MDRVRMRDTFVGHGTDLRLRRDSGSATVIAAIDAMSPQSLAGTVTIHVEPGAAQLPFAVEALLEKGVRRIAIFGDLVRLAQ